MTQETKKACRKCGETKPLSAFHRNAEMRDGHYHECKDCKRARAKSRYLDNIDEQREYNRTRYQRNPQWYKDRQRESCAREPEKHRARVALNRAVMDGKISKQPCHCGEPKAQAHHDDYSKPLDVRWLCVKHHNEAHGRVFYE